MNACARALTSKAAHGAGNFHQQSKTQNSIGFNTSYGECISQEGWPQNIPEEVKTERSWIIFIRYVKGHDPLSRRSRCT